MIPTWSTCLLALVFIEAESSAKAQEEGKTMSTASAEKEEGAAQGASSAGQTAVDKRKLVEESKQRNLDVIAGTQSLLSIIILGLACVVAFSSRLFAVIRFESIIHEFDPW